MKRFSLLLVSSIFFAGCSMPWVSHTPAKNPDPNHTHADFAVWVGGKQMDFSAAKYMTTEANETGARKYVHLHDGNGHVIHRHKPGLSLSDFFTSIGFTMTSTCLKTDTGESICAIDSKHWRMFVNGQELAFNGSYIFNDGDHILLSFGPDDQKEIDRELGLMTDDACRYSKTCPWKGPPPTENCIADPTVPCAIQ